MKQAEFNKVTQYYTNSTLNHSFTDNSIEFHIILTDETQDDTYLTLDTYLIDTSRDNLIEEFPVLGADTSVNTPALLCHQAKTKKAATSKYGQESINQNQTSDNLYIQEQVISMQEQFKPPTDPEPDFTYQEA